jgi:hypothetical protein
MAQLTAMAGNGRAPSSAGFPGFAAFPHYPGYSADFFDDRHFVLKGASPVTPAALVRPSFRIGFRISIAMPTPASAVPATSEAFAEMVRCGLALPQKQLQPLYFYDALGSALFDAITRLPEYTITRAELALLQEHGRSIIAHAGEPLELVELGPGNGEKLIALARHAPGAKIHLIDISRAALDTAAAAIERTCGVQVSTTEASFEDGLRALGTSDARRLVLFLGSNIGNFAPAEAAGFLRHVQKRSTQEIYCCSERIW